MEQAVNLFTKGLQTDTNPMMLGSDTLSDCLNGTIITMNGNEVALQNDMGNRRVDSAFLPPGYEPVGMKEYGGIIYVAAYNPLTGRGLLGSFPSPLKKIRGKDTESFLDLNNFVETVKNCRLDDFNYIVKRDQLTLLTQLDILLHAGDKFIILGSVEQPDPLIQSTSLSLSILNSVISNYYPGSGNKKLNMLVGVLNSQNEFVDITDSLLREPITGGNHSEGFYIWNKNNYLDEDTGVVHTLKNEEFNQDRLVEYVNTYAYKLVGPLCLKTSLNYPTEVEYSVYGEKGAEEGNRTYYFEITVTYTRVKDVYLDGLGFFINSLDGEEHCLINNIYETASLEDIPNEESGLVTTKAVYSTKITLPETGVLLNYTLMPIFEYPTGERLPQPAEIGQHMELVPVLRKGYIKEFSYTGELDLTKLGSDSIELNSWRYYNNLNSKETTFFIDYTAYPKKNSEILNICFNIGDNYITLKEPIEGSGSTTTTISWEDIIEPNKLYNVKIGYFKNNSFIAFPGTISYNEDLYSNNAKGVRENVPYEYAKITYEENNELVSHEVIWSIFGEDLVLNSLYVQYKFIIGKGSDSVNKIIIGWNSESSIYYKNNWSDYPPKNLLNSEDVIYYRTVINNNWSAPKIWRTKNSKFKYACRFITSNLKPVISSIHDSSLKYTPNIEEDKYVWMIYRKTENPNTFYDASTWSDPVKISNCFGEIGKNDINSSTYITFEFRNHKLTGLGESENCYFVSTELFNGNYYGTEPGWEGGKYNYNIHSNVYIDDFRTIESVLILPDLKWNVQLKEKKSYSSINESWITSSNQSKFINSKTLDEYNNNISCKLSFNENLYPEDNIPDIQITDIELESRLVNGKTFTFGNPTISDGQKEYQPTEQYSNNDLIEYIGIPSNSALSNSGLENDPQNNITAETILELEKAVLSPLLSTSTSTTFNLNFKYNIYETITGNPIQEDITIQYPIMSFRKFIQDNGLYLINPPYGNLSFLKGDVSAWCVTGNCSTEALASLIRATSASDRLSSNIYSANKNYINEVLLNGHTNDLFVAEFDDEDILVVWYGESKINLVLSYTTRPKTFVSTDANLANNEDHPLNLGNGFARVWLRYNKNSIVPILVYNSDHNNSLPSNIGAHILEVCNHVNRYYNYNTEEEIISGKYILDIYNCVKTKEFDFEVYNTIKYNIELMNNSQFNTNNEFFKFENISGLTSTFKDLNIKSSKLYKLIEESLLDYTINCGLILDNNIKMFDFMFAEYNPSYVYYLSSAPGVYRKYYIPKSKFSIGDNFLVPDLYYPDNILLTRGAYNGINCCLVQKDGDNSEYFYFDELPDIFTVNASGQ